MSTATQPQRRTDQAPPSAPSTANATSFMFTVGRSALVEALARVQLRSAKATLPILQSILVEATKGELSLSSSDLDQWITTRVVGAAATGTGSAALPAKRLQEIVAHLPSGSTVTVTITGARAKITAGRAKFDIVGLPADEWPRQPDFTPTLSASLEAKVFVSSLQRVQAHVADQGDVTFQGALLDASPDGLFLVGATRHSVGRAQLAVVSLFTTQAIIPRTAFGAIVKIFGGDETFEVAADDHQCRLTGATSSLTFRLIEGPYPPYQRLLDIPPMISARVGRAELIEAIKRVAVMVPPGGGIVLRFRENEVTLEGSSPDAGRADDVVACTRTLHSTDAARNVARIAPALALAALGTVIAEDVLLQYASDAKPIYVRDGADPSSKTLAMVAPMRSEHLKEEKEDAKQEPSRASEEDSTDA